MQTGESLISPGQGVGERRTISRPWARARRRAVLHADDAEGRQQVLVDRRTAREALLARRRRARQADVLPGGHQQSLREAVRRTDDDDRRHHPADAVARAGRSRRHEPHRHLLHPLRQRPPARWAWPCAPTQAPETAINAVRREIAQIDPELPFYGVRDMEERLSTSLIDRRTPMLLATGFAAVALLLAAIGIYGVLAYQVVAAPAGDRHPHGARRRVGQHLRFGSSRRRRDRGRRRGARAARARSPLQARRCRRSSTRSARWIRSSSARSRSCSRWWRSWRACCRPGARRRPIR